MTLERYNHPVRAIWDTTMVHSRWLLIENTLLRVLAGYDRPELADELKDQLLPIAVPVELVEQHEQKTGHDVGGFLEAYESVLLRQGLRQSARWLHWGLTSSDLVDTGVAFAVRGSMQRLADDVAALRRVISQLPEVPIVGRTHGQPASPTTIRTRFAFNLPLLEVSQSAFMLPPVMLSGAVGQYRVLPEPIAEHIASELGGVLAPRTSQVMSPAWFADRLHEVSKWVLAAEKIGLDLRLMATLGEYQPTPVKVGSSTMPGKVNPYLAERVCGLAKLWRGMYSAWVESRVLWLERDLHHSSVDRQLGDLFTIAGYMLVLVRSLLEDAEWVPQDLSRFEPSIDADLILARSVERVDKPRSWLYGQVRDAISEELLERNPSTAGVCGRLGWF